MIQPDAKCVVNGSKVNATIIALNPLLDMEVVMADVAKPQVQYGKDSVQIIIPQPSNFTNEELDVVDSSNTASTRWFVTASSQGRASTSNVKSGVPINKSMPGMVSQNRGGLKTQGGGGSQSNRNNLNRAAGGGSGSQSTSTSPPSSNSQSQASPSQASAPQGFSQQALSQQALSQQASPSQRGETMPSVGGDAGDGIPLTASGQIDLSRMTDEQKQKHGMTDSIPLTASGQIDLSRMTDEQKQKHGFTDNIPI
jgi:hypothetical protein